MEINGSQTEQPEQHEAETADTVRQQTESNPGVSAPSSTSSSPSHEFSFTVSLHSSCSFFTTTRAPANNLDQDGTPNKTNNKSQQSAAHAVDLTPADEIFFHGHLLPLHLLSTFPVAVSPRCSVDSFTIPIRELLHEDDDNSNNKGNCQNQETDTSYSTINCQDTNTKGRSFNSYEYNSKYHQPKQCEAAHQSTTNGRVKPKSFSLFSLAKRRKDTTKEVDANHQDKQQQHKNKIKFEVGHFLKRYIRMVRPLVFFKGRNEGGGPHIYQRTNYQSPPRQSYSFSGTLTPRIGVQTRKWDLMRRRSGQFSAPASMRTSPTNSGILVPPSGKSKTFSSKSSSSIPPCSSDSSTMEELQAAIQAAIAHCKNSRAVQENPTIIESKKHTQIQ